MKVFKLELNNTIITAIFSVVGILAAIILGSYNVKDLSEARKAEYVLEELKELRIALEKYYQLTNKYPNLTLEGVKDNLRLLDYTDSKGRLVSFAEIYGHESLPMTPEGNRLQKSNSINDVANFSKASNLGGWNYNYSGNTGEIHANLPENVYSQGVDWEKY